MASEKNIHCPLVGTWQGEYRKQTPTSHSSLVLKSSANSSYWSNTTRGHWQGSPVIQPIRVNFLKFEEEWRMAKSRSEGANGEYPAHHPTWLPLVLPYNTFNFLHYPCNSDMSYLICVSISLTVNSRVFCLVHQYVPEIKLKSL